MLQQKAYAKLNLSLDILGQRSDGYHDLRMVMQSVSLHDTVTLIPREAGVTLLCDDPGIPSGKGNIAYRAAEAFLHAAGDRSSGVEIHIEKRIPSQAGMAGGSSDAAAVLRGLNQLYKAPLTVAELCHIGSKIGADVPYCVVGGSQLAEGTGERLSPLPDMPGCSIVVCKPAIGVGTAEAFRRADQRPSPPRGYTGGVIDALKRSDLPALGRALGNDFEDILPIAAVSHLKELLRKAGALGAAMTGSGSAVFALFATGTQAAAARELLPKDLFACVCRPVPAYCFPELEINTP